MTFAARCPDCGTIFRIVPDQLKISEGLVRCGRCQHVFSAYKHQVTPLPVHSKDPVDSADLKESEFAQEPSINLKSSEERSLSSLLDDSKFLDSLFSEFQIGWADTDMNLRSQETSSFIKSKVQKSSNKKAFNLQEEEPADEVIDLDDDFTESLLRFGDSDNDSSALVIEEDDENNEFLASHFFPDSLSDNLSLGSEDTVLDPNTAFDTLFQVSEQKEDHAKSSVVEEHPHQQLKTQDQHQEDKTISLDSIVAAGKHEDISPIKKQPIVIPLPTSIPDASDVRSPLKTKEAITEDVSNKEPLAHKKNRQRKLTTLPESIPKHKRLFPEDDHLFNNSHSPVDEEEGADLYDFSNIDAPSTLSKQSTYPPSVSAGVTRIKEKKERAVKSSLEQKVSNLSFTQQKPNFWEKPVVKIGNIIFFVALLIILLAQLIENRNYIVSFVPEARPFLMTLSQPMGLTVDPPISFNLQSNVTIDSSSFNTIPTLPENTYLLEVIIRNRETHAVAVPFLELTLQNVSGEIIARKILSPEELGVTITALEPQQELLIRRNITVHANGVASVGYSTALLYL